MSETWSYDKDRRFDANGAQWHFVVVTRYPVEADSYAYEVYFRDDERTEFGVLRFERFGDNPYRNLNAIATKIMNNVEFRKTLLNPATEEVWLKSWK
jgi:hypothetical protein